MKYLDNLQKGIYEVKNILQSNSTIRKLLYYSTSDCISKDEVNYSTLNEYISVFPIYNINVEPFNKENFITITADSFEDESEENLISSILRVNIFSKNILWSIDDNKIRPLEIANIAISLLDSKKISTSNKIHFISAEYVILNDEYPGYLLIFGLEEGKGLLNDF